MRNALIATFENQPALMSEGAEQRFESFLTEASVTLGKIEAHTDSTTVMADDFWFSPDDWRFSYRPYVVKDGLLIIPVRGVLLHGVGYQLGNWATGYTYLTKALERGLADPEVKGIAWVCDSPGGHVAGNFELQDRIFEARKIKPQRAYAFESAYSAAYSIASATNSITVSRSGGVGSIGVLRVHYDYSVSLEKSGVSITFTKFGAHKTDGNSAEPLPKDVQARWQAEVNELGEEFVSIVARNRAMKPEDVRATEALCFTAKQATSNGLADKIGSLDDAIAVFAADMSNQEEDDMITQEQLDAAVASAKADGITAGKTEGKAEGKAEGVTAERQRISAILDSEEGKKRPSAALAAALDTDLTVEQAANFLSKIAEEKPVAAVVDPNAAKPRSAAAADFQAAMDSAEHPEAGAPAGGDGTGTQLSKAEQAMADAGYKPKSKAA